MNMHTLTYTQDWDSFLHDMQHKAVNTAHRGKEQSLSTGHGRFEFTHTNTYDDAIELLTHGWTEGRSELARSTEFAKALTHQGNAPAWQHAPAGAIPSVPAYCAGIAECMMTPAGDEAERSTPIVTILVNIASAHTVKTSEMINRGAAIVALIDQIESSGQRVELIASEKIECKVNNAIMDARVKVKEAHEHVDLDRVAMAVAHPSMLRRFMFRVTEFMLKKRNPYYGMPRDHEESELDHGTLYIPIIPSNETMADAMYGTEERAVKRIAALWEETQVPA